MSKEFTVELGGQQRRLRFTMEDAIALKREFKDELKSKSLNAFMFEEVLGFTTVDDPNVKDKQAYEWRNQFDPRARVAVLGLALRRGGTKASDSQVTEWLDKHCEEDGEALQLVFPAVCAAYYGAAITGRRVDIEETLAEMARHLGYGAEAGKDQPPTERPAAIPAAE